MTSSALVLPYIILLGGGAEFALLTGAFGSVWLAKDDQGNEFAVKRLIVETRDMEKVKAEVAVMV
jgi:hypothetical protein